jgi:hypothetical protein
MRPLPCWLGFAAAMSIAALAENADAQRVPTTQERQRPPPSPEVQRLPRRADTPADPADTPAVPAATPAVTPSAEVEPSEEYPPPSTRWKVAGVGLAAAAVFYGAGFGMSYAYPDVPGMKDLRTPVIGPWQGIANNGCVEGEDCSKVLVVVRSILMALDGVAQAGSLVVVLEGLFMPTQEVSAAPANETPRTPSAPAPAKPTPGSGDKNLFFVPMPMTVGTRGVGVGVV